MRKVKKKKNSRGKPGGSSYDLGMRRELLNNIKNNAGIQEKMIILKQRTSANQNIP